MHNIGNATADNICLYKAINAINKDAVSHVCELARTAKNVRAVSFNFHTPYPGTRELTLTSEGKPVAAKSSRKKWMMAVPFST